MLEWIKLYNSTLCCQETSFKLNHMDRLKIKDGKRLNDFYDFDFLKSVIIELSSIEYESYERRLAILQVYVLAKVEIILWL